MSVLLEPPPTRDSIQLRNRICMGSMTRNRCVADNMPTPATAQHYVDRARDGTGLIVAEGTFIHLNGAEWPHAPVMFEEKHALAWKPVTDAVHDVGGTIFFQPWHPGRIQNEQMPMLRDSGYPVYAPSAVPASGGKFRTLEGSPGYTSQVTAIEDPGDIIEQYRHSVRLAKKAGFDGIELLSQGGYLLHNFLSSRSNKRTDDYGGTVENRCRFPLEVLDAILSVWDPSRVGIKICPTDDYNDSAVSFDEMTKTYTYLIERLMERDLLYVNLSRRGCDVPPANGDDYFQSKTRPDGLELPDGYDPLMHFGGIVKRDGSRTMLMVNHEYSVAEAESLVRSGKIDLICFGRPYIYNPDVVSRIRKRVPFAKNTRGGIVNYGPYQNVSQNYNDWPKLV